MTDPVYAPLTREERDERLSDDEWTDDVRRWEATVLAVEVERNAMAATLQRIQQHAHQAILHEDNLVLPLSRIEIMAALALRQAERAG